MSVTDVIEDITNHIKNHPFPRPADYWRHFFTAPDADGNVVFDPNLPKRVPLTPEQYAEIAAKFGGA